MVTFSGKAWKAYETSKMPKYYFDIAQYRDYLKIGQPPFTPALTAMFCLEKSLEAMVAEGIENVFARHHEIAQHARDGARSLGLDLLPEPKYASDTVTAIKLPENVDGKTFMTRVNREFNVILGGGQQKLAGKIFRVGHMGWVEMAHIDEALEAAGKVLADMRS
jgi:aspartate aminotransferase-like enzyme